MSSSVAFLQTIHYFKRTLALERTVVHSTDETTTTTTACRQGNSWNCMRALEKSLNHSVQRTLAGPFGTVNGAVQDLKTTSWQKVARHTPDGNWPLYMRHRSRKCFKQLRYHMQALPSHLEQARSSHSASRQWPGHQDMRPAPAFYCEHRSETGHT